MYRLAEVLSALDILGLQRGVVAGEEAVWFESSSTGLLFEVPASADILQQSSHRRQRDKLFVMTQRLFRIRAFYRYFSVANLYNINFCI